MYFSLNFAVGIPFRLALSGKNRAVGEGGLLEGQNLLSVTETILPQAIWQMGLTLWIITKFWDGSCPTLKILAPFGVDRRPTNFNPPPSPPPFLRFLSDQNFIAMSNLAHTVQPRQKHYHNSTATQWMNHHIPQISST